METILGDFNAHHTSWNCQDTDPNGDRLWEMMYNQDYICINEDTLSRMGVIGPNSSNLNL